MPSSIANYFDNAATTPVDPRVLSATLPFLGDACGNAHSIHSFGTRAKAAIEKARESVANLIGAENPDEVVFTSGATESNNWVLRNFETGAISPFEHSSVREPAQALGFTILENGGHSVLKPKAPAGLVSVMRVNNEIGTIFEPSDSVVPGSQVHSDITQALGKIEMNVQSLVLDYASFSSHKYYGPKGVGGLYVRDGRVLEPILLGGEQEEGRRSGTLNVPGIVGFGEASNIAIDALGEDRALANDLRNIVLESLTGIVDMRVNGGERVSPFILSVSFRGIEGETLVLELDQAGFAISGGAACSSRSTEPSHVLTALGYEPEWLRGTIRISFGRFNTADSAGSLAKALRRAVGTLRELRV